MSFGTNDTGSVPSIITGATKGGTGKYVKTVIYDAQGRIASAVVEGTVGGTTPSRIGTAAEGSSEAVARVDHVHAPSGSIMDAWKAEAAADLGLTPDELIFLPFGDMTSLGVGWTGSNGSGGARTALTNAFGSRLSTGGGAGGFALFTSATGPTTASFEHVLAGSSKWWLKARFACNYAGSGGGPAGAASVIGIGAVAAGQALAAGTPHELMIGVDGNGANFVMTGGAGVTIDSGVPVDALVRDHKGWRDGSTSYYQINSGSAVSGSARPSANSRAVVLAYDSAAALQVADLFVAAVAFPARALGA